tara:strand:- start:193 stop:360 length:168 start_codon:yes stop_codon:yes gene_type:complete
MCDAKSSEDVHGVRPDRVCAVDAIFRRRCQSGLDEVDGKDERDMKKGMDPDVSIG